MRTLLLLAVVLTLASLSACGGGESPAENSDGDNGPIHANMSGAWTYNGREIENARFKCSQVTLSLDLRSFITSFSGIASGVGTTCKEKTDTIGQRTVTIGPITADSVRGTVNGSSVNFDLPVEALGFGAQRVSNPAWTNGGVAVGDSVVGDLSILFTWPFDSTRHAVRGNWTAVRR